MARRQKATAYMVMPFLQGVTARDTRRRMAHPPDEATTAAIEKNGPLWAASD